MAKTTHEIEVLKALTDEEALYIATWMAKAYDRHDPFPTVFCGKLYEDDPGLHRLFFLSVIDRASVEGEFVVTKDRNGFSYRMMPGFEDNVLNLDWRSGKDHKWDLLIKECGGIAEVRQRVGSIIDVYVQARTAVYGETGHLPHIRGACLGANPDFQQKGIARAIHEHNVKEAEKLGCLVLFGSAAANLPIYLRMGGRAVELPFTCPNELAAAYGKQWQVLQMLESGHYVYPAKL